MGDQWVQATMTAERMGRDNCPFCRIVAARVPAHDVLRTDRIVAFFPDAPAVLGHTLIVPRDHVRDVWELDRQTGHDLADAICRVAHAVRTATGDPGMNVIQSNGRAAGQTVFHLHVHVVPRRDGDRMPHLWPSEFSWPSEELAHLQAALRRVLDYDPTT